MNPVVSAISKKVSSVEDSDSYPEVEEDLDEVEDLNGDCIDVGVVDLVGVVELLGVVDLEAVGVVETMEDEDENSEIISRIRVTTKYGITNITTRILKRRLVVEEVFIVSMFISI